MANQPFTGAGTGAPARYAPGPDPDAWEEVEGAWEELSSSTTATPESGSSAECGGAGAPAAG